MTVFIGALLVTGFVLIVVGGQGAIILRIKELPSNINNNNQSKDIQKSNKKYLQSGILIIVGVIIILFVAFVLV